MTMACSVLKFRGAGQGPKALIAELLAGEIGRLAGLPVPEIVFIELAAELARTEPDPEIQSLIQDSAGLNIALDYLPGSVAFDPLVFTPDVQLASAVVWFDAFVCNVDRTVRNVNMLIWHRRLWLIDHGAALYFHQPRLEQPRQQCREPLRLDQGSCVAQTRERPGRGECGDGDAHHGRQAGGPRAVDPGFLAGHRSGVLRQGCAAPGIP